MTYRDTAIALPSVTAGNGGIAWDTRSRVLGIASRRGRRWSTMVQSLATRIGQSAAARRHRLLFGTLLAAHRLGVAPGSDALCAWGPPDRRNCPPSRERPRPQP